MKQNINVHVNTQRHIYIHEGCCADCSVPCVQFALTICVKFRKAAANYAISNWDCKVIASYKREEKLKGLRWRKFSNFLHE